MLEEKNSLQESQILELTHCLNLTIVKVCEHHEVLHELDTILLIFNKTLLSIIKALSHVRNMLSAFIAVCTSVI